MIKLLFIGVTYYIWLGVISWASSGRTTVTVGAVGSLFMLLRRIGNAGGKVRWRLVVVVIVAVVGTTPPAANYLYNELLFFFDVRSEEFRSNDFSAGFNFAAAFTAALAFLLSILFSLP